MLILAEENDPVHSDARAIMISLAIDSLNPNVHTIVELLQSRNQNQFRFTHVDEIVCLEQLAEKLLAQSALTPGLSRVYLDLLTQSRATNEIYQVDVPTSWIESKVTYGDAERKLVRLDDEDIILVGFSTRVAKTNEYGEELVNGNRRVLHERKVVINPKSSQQGAFTKHHVFQPGDTLFLIAYDLPEVEALVGVLK